jgi:hypothetical protein
MAIIAKRRLTISGYGGFSCAPRVLPVRCANFTRRLGHAAPLLVGDARRAPMSGSKGKWTARDSDDLAGAARRTAIRFGKLVAPSRASPKCRSFSSPFQGLRGLGLRPEVAKDIDAGLLIIEDLAARASSTEGPIEAISKRRARAIFTRGACRM